MKYPTDHVVVVQWASKNFFEIFSFYLCPVGRLAYNNTAKAAEPKGSPMIKSPDT